MNILQKNRVVGPQLKEKLTDRKALKGRNIRF